MVNSRAEAFAPSTVANLGVGFDILGLAVSGAGDTIVAEPRSEKGAVIASIDGDKGELPYNADKNVASISANAFLDRIQAPVGVTLKITKGIPAGSGLGSSAASAVAATVAVNALFGNPLSREELLPACLEGEAAVSGYHADNVAPCLLGGITLTNGIDMTRIRRLPVPEGLFFALATPDVVVPTIEARAALPATITLKQMVHQTGAVAELVDAIYRGDVWTMAQMMISDEIVEPARQHLMPHMDEVRIEAKRAGALGLVISGAGPTLCAICDDSAIADKVAKAMQAVYTQHEMACLIRYSGVLKGGARVLSVIE